MQFYSTRGERVCISEEMTPVRVFLFISRIEKISFSMVTDERQWNGYRSALRQMPLNFDNETNDVLGARVRLS